MDSKPMVLCPLLTSAGAALGGRSTAVRPVRGTLREINCKGECDCTATSIHLEYQGRLKLPLAATTDGASEGPP